MKQGLKRRMAKLEAQLGADETKLRRLVMKLNIDPERMLSAIKGREKELARHLVDDGITWEGFLMLRRCLGQSRLGR